MRPLGALSQRAGLPDAKIDIVRTLVAGAPDKVISGLRNALAAAEGDTALAGVRRVVEAEVAERNLRNKALQPVAPLFIDRRGDPDRLAFPPRALPMLWRGLRDVAAEDVATAALAMADYEPGVTSNEAFDRLTARLVEELEARTQRDIMAALDVIETDRPGGGAALRNANQDPPPAPG